MSLDRRYRLCILAAIGMSALALPQGARAQVIKTTTSTTNTTTTRVSAPAVPVAIAPLPDPPPVAPPDPLPNLPATTIAPMDQGTAKVGMVWVNTHSGIYWRPGSRYYGKTKQGRFMSEQDALQAGYRAGKGQ